MSKHVPHARMKTLVSVAGAALSLAFGSAVQADNVAQQTVSFSIASISEIEVAAGTVTLNVVAPTAGASPSAATAGSTYDITTNASAGGKKITAALDSNMPSNVTLTVNLTAPTAPTVSGSSQGAQTLSTTAVDVVTGIQGAAQTGVTISYSLTAAVSAQATTTTQTKQVTYTIVDT